jgi:hypothetical protein
MGSVRLVALVKESRLYGSLLFLFVRKSLKLWPFLKMGDLTFTLILGVGEEVSLKLHQIIRQLIQLRLCR